MNDAAFHRALGTVLRFEGGAAVTNDPADPGGLTKYGISQRAFPDLDIRNLTLVDAEQIYRSHYWEEAGCDLLPGQMAFVVFDCAVNQGVRTAKGLLQKTLGVTVDYEIGPQTVQAAIAQGSDAVARFTVARIARYQALPTFPRYGGGWMRRAITAAMESQQ